MEKKKSESDSGSTSGSTSGTNSSSSRTSTNTSTSSSISEKTHSNSNQIKVIHKNDDFDKNNVELAAKNLPEINRFKEYVLHGGDKKPLVLIGSMVIIVFTFILLKIFVTNEADSSKSSALYNYTHQILKNDEYDFDETDTSSDYDAFDEHHTTIVTNETEINTIEHLSTTNSYETSLKNFTNLSGTGFTRTSITDMISTSELR